MNLLIRQQRIYEKVYYDDEKHFVGIVKAELAKILDGFSIVDFTPFIIGDEGSRRCPDLAIIDRAYRMWVVVEVELDRHSLQHHVIPQVRTFVAGNYEEPHAHLLHDRDPNLDLSKLCDLVAYVKPEVAVLVNSKAVLQDGWGVIESDHSARLMFLESYRSHDGDVIFGLSGFRPAPRAELLAKVKKDKWLNALVCKRTSDIPPSPDGQIRIYEGERPDLWRVIRTADTVMLLPPGGLTVRGDRNYEIVKTDDGKYQLQIL